MPKVNEMHEDSYKNHENRPDLAGEHPIGDALQLIFLIVFLIANLLDILLFHTNSTIRSKIHIFIRLPIGLSLISFGAWLALKGIQIVFKDLRPNPIMITEGLFSFVRHPIYLGAMLIYLGVLSLTLSSIGGIAFIFVVILYNWLARHEENLMIEIFGETYQQYIHQVPMWIPRSLKITNR
jgi:protein-S-isoprenylcysteine O-methyltransferase Ste14